MPEFFSHCTVRNQCSNFSQAHMHIAGLLDHNDIRTRSDPEVKSFFKTPVNKVTNPRSACNHRRQEKLEIEMRFQCSCTLLPSNQCALRLYHPDPRFLQTTFSHVHIACIRLITLEVSPKKQHSAPETYPQVPVMNGKGIGAPASR